MRISDWSSDVCSSDLFNNILPRDGTEGGWIPAPGGHEIPPSFPRIRESRLSAYPSSGGLRIRKPFAFLAASREIVWIARRREKGNKRDSRFRGNDEVGEETRPDRPAPNRRSPASTEIGRAHVYNPVTNAHLVCRILLEKKNH